MKSRCAWCLSDPIYLRYHDEEWGVPLHDDARLFEMLMLEGAQAGLSWLTILKRREGYRRAFARFDAKKVVRFNARKVASLLKDPGIIRHRGKIEAVIANARAFLAVQKEHGSFDRYLWSFAPKSGRTRGAVAMTPASTAMSRDLRARGFRFVGPSICHAFMQAVGMVNDHAPGCFRAREIGRPAFRAGTGDRDLHPRERISRSRPGKRRSSSRRRSELRHRVPSHRVEMTPAARRTSK